MRDFEKRDDKFSGGIVGSVADEDVSAERTVSHRPDFIDPMADFDGDNVPRSTFPEHSPDGGTTPAGAAPLFADIDAENFRSRWREIQTDFVDEPRGSVERADALVKEVVDRLTSAFASNRSDLERQWSAGDEVSTEDLRRTLQSYRSFFERLLTI